MVVSFGFGVRNGFVGFGVVFRVVVLSDGSLIIVGVGFCVNEEFKRDLWVLFFIE